MKVICFIILIYQVLTNVVCLTTENCVIPPLKCPNHNVTFWLYTRENRYDPFKLKPHDPESLSSAPWVRGAVVKILIHGYTGHKDFSPSTEIRPVYLEHYDYNIISIDYHNIVKEPCYFQAAKNTKLVGMCTAELIDELVEKHGFELPMFHIIGFSLGAHVAGFVGNYLNSGTLDRITALDPALPMFATANNDEKIDASDANFVDVLHTNALMKGKLEACGVVDFFANGGMSQPGCKATRNRTKSGCDHARAPEYYAESILSKVGFYGRNCASWIQYVIGWCQMFPPEEEVLFGEYTPARASGLYFFDTNSKPPYARGPTNE